ncbi:MAG TPA: ornithine cyclodeaminase family protein [Acidobacteriota bacterium]|nr:ornithine cyclodeaminase family protein [Acidobacteriota bacterium]
MAILLRESDVKKLATMQMALDAVEQAFRLQGAQRADNAPRRRCRLDKGMLHVMSASLPSLGLAGLKSYTSVPGRVRFHVLLYGADGSLAAIIEADLLGQMRTGAASGVATRYMARPNASRLGIYGTGWQARSQIQAVCAVRPIKTVVAWSRNPENRETFCKEMTQTLGIGVYPGFSPEEAAKGMDIVVTATTSKEPVLKGEWLSKGTHVNAVGSNSLSRQEIDVETVRRCACVVVDSTEQSLLESGDLARASQAGAFYWEDARELGMVVMGEFPGREDDAEITLFKSNGIALEDVAFAGKIYEAAMKSGLGQPLPF